MMENGDPHHHVAVVHDAFVTTTAPKPCDTFVLPKTAKRGDDYMLENCPNEAAWLKLWATARNQSDHVWSAVFVGANKGYVVANVLQTLTGKGPTPLSLYTRLKTYTSDLLNSDAEGKLHELCGSCCDCLEVPYPTLDLYRANKVMFRAIEPVAATSRWLRHVFHPLSPIGSWINVTQAAVSSTENVKLYAGVTMEHRGRRRVAKDIGDERAAIHFHRRHGGEPRGLIPLTTIDELVPPGTVCDLVITDAEGHDKEILFGAWDALEEHRILVYQFELHGNENTKWKMTVFERMERMGYECYLYLKFPVTMVSVRD
eukprot:PhF_6_TR28326/c0_g1_i1/m.41970